MKEITNFNYLKQYFCKECNHFHRKSAYNPILKKSTISKKFKEHKEFAVKLDSHELWMYKFKKSWRNHVENQKRTGLPIGLPKRDKGKSKAYT